MDAPLNQVIIPASLPELFSAWNRFHEAVLYAGGTSLIGARSTGLKTWGPYKNDISIKQENSPYTQPPVFLCLDKITELHNIARTEHYLEIGSMVKLNKLINIGKIVPDVLRLCLENIAGVQLRNIATIGGNICSSVYGNFPDLPAPLVALDAQYELRSAGGIRWVSASWFHGKTEYAALKSQELLSRVRLPLHHWDYAIYKKFREEAKALVFLVKTHKNILSDIRIIYKSDHILRNKEAEDLLNGKNLPLNRKTIEDFIVNWSDFLNQKQEESDFSKNIIINSIRQNIYNLSE